MVENRLSKLVAQKLLQINAIKINAQNPFTWASGLKSPIYCDNRLTLSDPTARQLVKEGLADLVREFEFDVIGGIATAGIPHGAILADYLGLPFIYVREKAKEHGRQNQIEGRLERGQRVVLIEDLISTGGSSLKAVEAVRGSGNEVAAVVAIFTYGFSVAEENFREKSCSWRSLSNYATLLEEALELDMIEQDNLETLKRWSADPTGWYSSHNH